MDIIDKKKKAFEKQLDIFIDEDEVEQEQEEKKEFGSNEKLFKIDKQEDFNLSISDRSSVQSEDFFGKYKKDKNNKE